MSTSRRLASDRATAPVDDHRAPPFAACVSGEGATPASAARVFGLVNTGSWPAVRLRRAPRERDDVPAWNVRVRVPPSLTLYLLLLLL
mmetsp:Transcript_15433/g.48317  ORF Transcript_15433/g.48317 Transcript_15433/m.48317 type:complete len:88 (+) Transcript_15433:1035-1298(+)